MSTVELERVPALGPLYRRAMLGVIRPRSGDRLPDTTLVLRGVAVDRAHFAAYDRVCGFRIIDTLPATYPHVLAFPVALALMCRPEFPFPLAGLVHVANRITVHRPLGAHERLDFAVHAANLRPHDRGQQFDVITVATVDGTPVWHDISTYLHRSGKRQRTGTQEGSAGEPASAPESSARARSGTPGDSAAKRSTGTSPVVPNAVWRIGRQVGTEYARISGDRNPIHTSRLGARLFGFRRPIAHGMWSKARCLAQLASRLPDRYAVSVTFQRPILLPATVAFRAEPVAAPAPTEAASAVGADTADHPATAVAAVALARRGEAADLPAGPGWDFALYDARSGKPHLAGTLRKNPTD